MFVFTAYPNLPHKRSSLILKALVEEDKKRIEDTVKAVVDKFEAIETMLNKKSDKSNEVMITEFRQQLESMSALDKENVKVALDDAINLHDHCIGEERFMMHQFTLTTVDLIVRDGFNQRDVDNFRNGLLEYYRFIIDKAEDISRRATSIMKLIDNGVS